MKLKKLKLLYILMQTRSLVNSCLKLYNSCKNGRLLLPCSHDNPSLSFNRAEFFVYITKFRVADYKQPHGIWGMMNTEAGLVPDNGVGVCVCTMTDQNIEAAAVCMEFPKAASRMRWG